MYCRTCRYSLQELTRSECPECGRAFDVSKRSTWDAVPARPGVAAGVLLFSTAAFIGLFMLLYKMDVDVDGRFYSADNWVLLAVPIATVLAGVWANRRWMMFGFGMAAAVTIFILQMTGREIIWQMVKGCEPVAAWFSAALGYGGTVALARMGGWFGWRCRVGANRLRTSRLLSRWKTKWYRPRNLVLGTTGVVLTVAGWIFFQVLGVVAGEPTIAVDYGRQLTERRRELTGLDPIVANACAGELDEALGRLNEIVEELDTALLEQEPTRGSRFGNGGLDFNWVRGGDDLPALLDPERHALAQLREDGVWQEIRRLALGPMPLPEIRSDQFIRANPNPRPASVSRFYYAGLAAMRFDAVEGNTEEFADTLETLLAVGQLYSYQVRMMGIQRGWATIGGTLRELRLLLSELDFNESACRRILQIIDGLKASSAEYPVDVAEAVFNDGVQRIFTDDGSGDGYYLPEFEDLFNGAMPLQASSWNHWKEAWHSRFKSLSRRQLTARHEEAVGYVRAEMQRPPHLRWQDLSILNGSADEEWSDAVWLFLEIRGIHRDINQHTHLLQGLEQTRLMLAIERYSARHASLPENLELLVPEYLSTELVDAVTDMPFGYRILEGNTYLIYSYGYDRVDNNGEYDKERRGLGAYEYGAGFDVPLTRPRPSRD